MSSKSGKPYKVAENTELGRYLIATRDISPGESIIDEMPLVTGPVAWDNFSTHSELGTNALCLICCVKYSTTTTTTCALCGLKFCSEPCSRNEIHCNQECKVLQNLRKRIIQPPNFPTNNNKILYNFILTIRCLTYAKSDVNKWSQLISLQSSVEDLERRGAFSGISDLFDLLKWEDFGIFQADEVLDRDKCPLNFQKLAKHCLGAMIMNGFSLRSRQGLYFLSSFMAHSCIMNTDRQIQAQTGRMVTRAGRRILAGEPITTTYLTIMEGTHERWRQIREGWMFTCHCERCLSAGHELGTCLSTIKCPNCSQLSLCPTVQIGTDDDGLRWSCSSNSGCGYEILQTEKVPESTSNICASPWKVLEIVEKSKPGNLQNLDQVEEWLNKYCGDMDEDDRTIHRDHSIFIQVKLYLAQSYGRDLENGVGSLDDGRLKRKLTYCRDVLRVLDKLFEGIYEMKGVLLFEIWSTLIEIRQRRQNNEQEGSDDHFEGVEICNAYLAQIREKAVEILQYSFPNSPEASMLQLMQNHD